MTATWREVRPLKILDFDLECRPLSWYGGDFVTKEITAIGAQWVGTNRSHCWLLGVDEPLAMLSEFRAWYDDADMVTGHYIIGFDLPLLNAAMIEYGLPPLQPKRAQDTKVHLVRFSGLSKSQENLGALLKLHLPKVQMDQDKWRQANRLTPEGIALTKRRVMGDVRQHMELRARLLELGMLDLPQEWRPSSRNPDYVP